MSWLDPQNLLLLAYDDDDYDGSWGGGGALGEGPGYVYKKL